MSRKVDYVKFWNDYIDYCVDKGSTIFTLEDKISIAKDIEHSKTKTISQLTIDLNANIKSGHVNIYPIRVENYINKRTPGLNQMIFDVLKRHKIKIENQLNELGWNIIFHEPQGNVKTRKIYIPGVDLCYDGKNDLILYDFYHRASEDLYRVLRPIYDSMSFLKTR